MSRVNKYKCDHCGKEAVCHYDEVGWIVIDSVRSITVTKGRAPNGRAITEHRHLRGNGLHFCCTTCLAAYIEDVRAG